MTNIEHKDISYIDLSQMKHEDIRLMFNQEAMKVQLAWSLGKDGKIHLYTGVHPEKDLNLKKTPLAWNKSTNDWMVFETLGVYTKEVCGIFYLKEFLQEFQHLKLKKGLHST